MGRSVRDWRLGEAYTEESIMARLSRSAVNRISVDESMIVGETRQTMTVHVPGTGRRLRMTVAKKQVVRHGGACASTCRSMIATCSRTARETLRPQ
jgi:hypothetical protein